MKRLILAAEKGDADAQFNLGIMYDNGLDDNNRVTGGNRAKAIKWLLRAAEQGLPRAQLKLAEVYADRWAPEQDHMKACSWFMLATTSLTGIHRQKAQTGLDRVSSQLSPIQVAKATRLAQDWKPIEHDGAFAPAGLRII